MKIYIAARFGRKNEIKTFAAMALRSAGHTVVSRWHDMPDAVPDRTEAEMDIADIDAADVVVLYTDKMGSLNSGGGRFFEMGYAYARGKAVFVVGDPEIVFCRLPRVVLCSGLSAVVAILAAVQDRVARRIAAALCRAEGTAQCAALCLSHSSLHTTGGQCPESMSVWGHRARAAAAAIEEWSPDLASVILEARMKTGNQNDQVDERAAGQPSRTGGHRDRPGDVRPGPED